MLVAALILDSDDALEGADLLYTEDTTGNETALPEVVQSRCALVADLDDADALPDLGLA
jgi:hypothetical protein